MTNEKDGFGILETLRSAMDCYKISNGKNEVLTGQRTGTWMIAIGTSSLRDITFLINLPCLK